MKPSWEHDAAATRQQLDMLDLRTSGLHYTHIDRLFRESPLPEYPTTRAKTVYKQLSERDNSRYSEHMPKDIDNTGMYLLWLQTWATARYIPKEEVTAEDDPEPKRRIDLVLDKTDPKDKETKNRGFYLLPTRWIDEKNLMEDLREVHKRGSLPHDYVSILSHHPSIIVGEEVLLRDDTSYDDVLNILSTAFSLHGQEAYASLLERIRTAKSQDHEFLKMLEGADNQLSIETQLLNEEINILGRTVQGEGKGLKMNPAAYMEVPDFGDLKDRIDTYITGAGQFRLFLNTLFNIKPYKFWDKQSKTDRAISAMLAAVVMMDLTLAVVDPIDIYENLAAKEWWKLLFRLAVPISLHLANVFVTEGMAASSPENQRKHQEFGSWDFAIRLT
ncbi:hypothetical protein H6764_02815 [Candidatus Nomurabacteria bacterium]|nr:hypothetical protein [Candidatus Nomurabacteria bacterium]